MQTRFWFFAVAWSMISLTGIEAQAQDPCGFGAGFGIPSTFGNTGTSGGWTRGPTIIYQGPLPGPIQHQLYLAQIRMNQMQRAQARAASRPHRLKIAQDAAQRDRERKEIAARNPVQGQMIQVGLNIVRPNRVEKIVRPEEALPIGLGVPQPPEAPPLLEPQPPPNLKPPVVLHDDPAKSVEGVARAITAPTETPIEKKPAPAIAPAPDHKAIPPGQTPPPGLVIPRGQTPPPRS